MYVNFSPGGESMSFVLPQLLAKQSTSIFVTCIIIVWFIFKGFRMSRNHKDKYESSNPRRTHTIMSTEDANSGKKSYWPELEITGSIRNLSPNLWQLTHLTALYLNDNSLQRIPSEIGRLVNLRALDLSSNKLRSLPAELGDLIYLK